MSNETFWHSESNTLVIVNQLRAAVFVGKQPCNSDGGSPFMRIAKARITSLLFTVPTPLLPGIPVGLS